MRISDWSSDVCSSDLIGRPSINSRLMTDMLNLHVNGEQRRIANGASLADLVRQLELDPAKVAVERNLEVVPRSTYGDVRLSDGDELEIVHFVGGGDDGDSRSEEQPSELQSLMRH